MVEYKLRAIRGMIFVFSMTLLAAILGYLLRMTLARNLSVEEFGLFYSVLAFVALFTLFKDLGLGQALVKYIPQFIAKDEKKLIKSSILAVFYIQFIAAMIISFVLIILSKVLAIHFFHTEAAVWIIIFIALSYWLSNFQDVFMMTAQGFQAPKYYAIIETLRTGFILVLVLIAFQFYKTPVVPAFLYFFVMLFLPFIYFVFLLKIFPEFLKIKAQVAWTLIKKFFVFGFPVLMGAVGGLLISYTDTLTLTWFRSLEEVGFYSVALPTVMLLWYIPQAISSILFPMVSEMDTRGHHDYMRQGIGLIYKYSFLIIIPLAFTMLLFSDIIIRVLFGEKYMGGAIALQILAIGSIFYTLALINTNVLAGLGKVKINAAIVLIAAAINLVLNIIFVPKYGLIAAAATTSFSYLLMMILNSLVLRRHIQIKLPILLWMKILISGIAFILTITVLKYVLYTNAWLELAICLFIAITVYGIFVFFIFRILGIEVFKKESILILKNIKNL